jgi:hypothetical protein
MYIVNWKQHSKQRSLEHARYDQKIEKRDKKI